MKKLRDPGDRRPFFLERSGLGLNKKRMGAP